MRHNSSEIGMWLLLMEVESEKRVVSKVGRLRRRLSAGHWGFETVLMTSQGWVTYNRRCYVLIQPHDSLVGSRLAVALKFIVVRFGLESALIPGGGQPPNENRR